MTDIILVPGLWLDGSSWDAVVPPLQQAGHRTRALTLPGMQAKAADRSTITLRDHVDAVVAEVDAAEQPVVLVGHSLGAAVVWAAVDARPDRVVRAVLVGGFPTANGSALLGGLPAHDGEVPFPGFDTFEEEDRRDLDEQAQADFAARAIPSPEAVLAGPQRLSDERRYDVPVTVVCTEFTAANLQDWVTEGEASVSELARIRDVEYVDLPTGHWPQVTRSVDLAEVLLERSSTAGGRS